MPTGKKWLEWWGLLLICFNPCSSGWCLPAGPRLAPWLLPFGFNPCSSGWCLPAVAHYYVNEFNRLVSILVLLDDAYRLGAGDLFFFIISVSILVLLDDAYRLEGRKEWLTKKLCFNPCSSGWCLPAIDWKGSSSLWYCFNPCSSGWCLPAFLSTKKVGISELGFNPCSSGWCLPACLNPDFFIISDMVSILVLLDDAYRQKMSRFEISILFVSILVLLDDAYRL